MPLTWMTKTVWVDMNVARMNPVQQMTLRWTTDFSVDVQHDLAADAALQQRVQRGRRLAPGTLQFDLTIEPAVRNERAQAAQVGRPAGVPGCLVELVQGVDARAGRSIKSRRAERDGLVGSLRRDVDDDATLRDVLDGLPERGTAHRVKDHVEVAVNSFGDLLRAEPAQQRIRRSRVAHECGGARAAGVRELDRDPPNATRRAGDQHALGEQQPPPRIAVDLRGQLPVGGAPIIDRFRKMAIARAAVLTGT
jgi:hypothetical protein